MLRHLPLVVLAGCTELVVIGDECRGESCIVELDGRVIEVPLDAGFDARLPDLDARAEPVLDAAIVDARSEDHFVAAPDDASVWMMPALTNPSFEVTDGQPGDVAALSLPTGTVIAPWFSCQAIGTGPLTGVRAETLVAVSDDNLPTVVAPREGLSFIAMQYFGLVFPPALVQQPSMPLRAGTNYGFALDVRTSNPSAKLALQVYGANTPCADVADSTLLAATDPITTTGWQTVCLRFKPKLDFPWFSLVENAASPVSGDRLFFDNLRSVESCPP